MTMTAKQNATIAQRTGWCKLPRDTLERSQSVSPPPVLSPVRITSYPLSDSEEFCRSANLPGLRGNKLVIKDWTPRESSVRDGRLRVPGADPPNALLKSVSVACLDNRLSVFKGPSHKENVEEPKDGVGGVQLNRSTLSLGSAANQRNRSLGNRTPTRGQALDIRRKISEWECRRDCTPKLSLFVDRGDQGDLSASEGGSSMLTSPCSEKTFDFRGYRRMSKTFSECSYPETEEEEALDRDSLHRFERRSSRTEPANAFIRGYSRKDSSAVLNRIQKIERALKDNPGRGLPQLPSSCYSVEAGRKKSITSGTLDGSVDTGGKVGPVHNVNDKEQSLDKNHKTNNCPSPEVNPVPKPKRTFEYEADRNHRSKPSNGLPGSPGAVSPPPLPSTPAPPVTRRAKKDAHRKSQSRKSLELEDASSVQSLSPTPPVENGTEKQRRSGPKSTLEENAYEDIVVASNRLKQLEPQCIETNDIHMERSSAAKYSLCLSLPIVRAPGDPPKENPYEDVDPKGRLVSRKSQPSPDSCSEPPSRMWRMYTSPTQLPNKGSSQSLRVGSQSERKSRHVPRLPKRHSHDDMLLLAQLAIPPSPSSLNEDSLSTTSGMLSTRRSRRIPKLVQRINSIYSAKRGKKRLKKLSMSNLETASLRDENSESESDSDDRFKAHTQRLVHIQSMLKRAPSYRTLELELIEWQERELFEYFVVVSMKKKPMKNTYIPEVTYQFPKLERQTKQVREAEERLKAIPQFCFPDARDWTPVSEYNSETFSFMLTGEDGSRRFGYCRRLLPSGKGPRLPEVYCVISRLGCFDLFSKILDEVERRRGISAALVYPFMRSLMESPFPAPGKTIRVKTFLPGAGNEVIELRRPMDSRLEHVDFECLFRCLSVRQIIRIFASLLLERRVIFVAEKLSTLSSCSHAIVALLYPFSWQHTFIPVLPSSMIDIVCCPTPFLVGLLSSSLPKLKELPVEEALMVDLGSDRFLRQMDDEDSLLPRKLQAALEQALERKNDLINQDSDSDSDEEYNSLNALVSEVFIRFFVETIGHYSLFLVQNERGERVFQRETFRKSVASKSIRRFLEVFMESQMFTGFIQDRELRKCRAKGLFEQRVEQYLEELPDTEQSGVNKFWRGLGNKMKFLHKKN
ncbi:suppression of tumorigenicity 5 protein isoform X2 [Xenopus tropicalis]|nr:suppression of tumorigenicity 5 protein isoform X2 [Xenopus tropicalis]